MGSSIYILEEQESPEKTSGRGEGVKVSKEYFEASINLDVLPYPGLQNSFKYNQFLYIPDTGWDLIPVGC